jgi:hypothetical protein
LVAVSCGSPSASPATESGPTAAETTTTIASSTSSSETTQPATTSSAPEPSTTAAAQPGRHASIWAIPAGLEVAVAGFDGLHLLTGSDDRIINTGVFEDVAADPTGDGWFVEEPSTIRHIADDGTEQVVVTAKAGTSLQLHDAGMVDGHVTIFYNINRPHLGVTDNGSDVVTAADLAAGTTDQITEAGGWESSVDFNFGGGNLVGVLSSEGTASPLSFDLNGHLDPVDLKQVGLDTNYDFPGGPRAMTVSPDGARLSWVTWNMTPDEGNLLGYQLTIIGTDGSGRRQFTLPNGPTRADSLDDHGDYIVASSRQLGDNQATSAMLVDAETGGMLVLPIPGSAAATGQWGESPRWPIPSPVAEDVTQEVHALEPQWADGRDNFDYAKALTDLLLAGDADSTDECASTARTFPATSLGDGPFYIEMRQFCDDSVAGVWYEVTIVGPQPDGSLTGGAARRTLCTRGVTLDGLCV